MTMQNNIDIVRRVLRRNMLETNFFAAPNKIDNQRQFKVRVAVSANCRHRRTGRTQLIQNPIRANIAQMPNFIRSRREIGNLVGQLVMSVGQNKNLRHVEYPDCFRQSVL